MDPIQWTAVIQAFPFPAHAGMDPADRKGGVMVTYEWLPRTRGDGPFRRQDRTEWAA